MMLRTGFPANNIVSRYGLPCFYKLLNVDVLPKRSSSSQDSNDKDSQQNDPPKKDPENTVNISESRTSSEISSENEKNPKNAAAKKKLFSLLSQFQVDQDYSKRITMNLTLAKAVKRPRKEERFKNLDTEKEKTPEEKLQLAVKSVAESVTGDSEQTQLELNEKLQTLNMASKSPKVDINENMQIEMVDDEMKMNIMSSVKSIAETVTDPTPSSSIISKLTQRLDSVESKSSSIPKKSIDNVLKGMKVERDADMEMERMRERSQALKTRMLQRKNAINIFQSPALDIFKTDEEGKIDSKKRVWQILEDKNLKLLVQFAPTNGFEEMIRWTEQGKHWKFPIDNQTEMEEENVGFHEHVFLEQHLHGFPTKGPIRVFMEHVIVGLSKNPYITVDRKIENINWFRDYFKEKEKAEILKEYGALA